MYIVLSTREHNDFTSNNKTTLLLLRSFTSVPEEVSKKIIHAAYKQPYDSLW